MFHNVGQTLIYVQLCSELKIYVVITCIQIGICIFIFKSPFFPQKKDCCLDHIVNDIF